jgi:hypothetical protein
MWYIARASELGAGAAAGSSGAAVSINTRGAITNFGYRPATAALAMQGLSSRAGCPHAAMQGLQLDSA